MSHQARWGSLSEPRTSFGTAFRWEEPGGVSVMPFEQPNLSAGLSLVVATLDEGAELHETVRSAVGGSVRPDEVIVVDDGGSDGSCDALEQDAGCVPGLKVYRIERSGVAAARNIGSGLATGSQLVFLDAHCRLDPVCLRILREVLDRRPDAIVAPAMCDFGGAVYGCGARLIDAELRIRWLPPHPQCAAAAADRAWRLPGRWQGNVRAPGRLRRLSGTRLGGHRLQPPCLAGGCRCPAGARRQAPAPISAHAALRPEVHQPRL
jgi:hypothetical protein